MRQTGGPIYNFKEGWAFIWPKKKVHYWYKLKDQLGFSYYKTLCGQYEPHKTNRPPLIGGTFPNCKNCERINAKSI